MVTQVNLTNDPNRFRDGWQATITHEGITYHGGPASDAMSALTMLVHTLVMHTHAVHHTQSPTPRFGHTE